MLDCMEPRRNKDFLRGDAEPKYHRPLDLDAPYHQVTLDPQLICGISQVWKRVYQKIREKIYTFFLYSHLLQISSLGTLRELRRASHTQVGHGFGNTSKIHVCLLPRYYCTLSNLYASRESLPDLYYLICIHRIWKLAVLAGLRDATKITFPKIPS